MYIVGWIYEFMWVVGISADEGVGTMHRWAKNELKMGKFYGMELARVGAFTEKWGSGYRNPVQILA